MASIHIASRKGIDYIFREHELQNPINKILFGDGKEKYNNTIPCKIEEGNREGGKSTPIHRTQKRNAGG